MKVSKSSWHYRMISYFPWEILDWKRYSLCKYFWLVVWTFVFCLVVVPLVAVAALGSAAVVAFIILYPIFQFFFWFDPVMPFVSGIVDSVLLVMLWCWYRKEYVDSDKCSETASLVGQYIAAKHRKVCPLLDFE